jgi:tetratricopeptide (TPR) repeat protein
VVLTTAKSKQDSIGTYGTVTERLGSISYAGDGRWPIWVNSIDYIKANPFKGCGYGNWKIASIPYSKTWVNDFTVPIHSHNDFLELSAEIGIQGGIAYLALFVCLLLYTSKVWFSNCEPENKLVAAFSLMAIGGYFVDACLNFPLERPIMQIFFALFAAIVTNAFIGAGAGKSNKFRSLIIPPKIYLPVVGCLLIPTVYFTFSGYRSMVAQMIILPDLKSQTHTLSFREVNDLFPTFPNLTTKGQPIDAIKGSYYYYEKKYDSAFILLDKGITANPYSMYPEFMKANVFFDLNKPDSACYYAGKAFYARPRTKAYYQNYLNFCSSHNDSSAIRKAFEEFTRHRNEPDAWHLYLAALFSSKNADKPSILSIADSAVKLFPHDTVLLQNRAEIQRSLQQFNTVNNANNPVITGTASTAELLSSAITAFNKGEYNSAAILFTELSRKSPSEYILLENTGICYFNLKNYPEAITWFDKVLRLGKASDGKTEFFKAKCMLILGKKEEGCRLLQLARLKQYTESEAFILQYCK